MIAAPQSTLVSGGTQSSPPTLLFCTCYMGAESAWVHRYRPWIDYYQTFPLLRTATFMLDDSSPYVPEDDRLVISDELPARVDPEKIHLHRFAEHLGNKRHRGWWRSFLFSLQIARRYGLRKIVHVESDAYLLTQRVVSYLTELERGWTALWCPLYQLPEAAIEVVAEDQFAALQRFADMDLREVSRTMPEKSFPFTHVEKKFYGDRYGEFRSRIPRTADYACQVQASTMAPVYRGST
jgi:hypothetical protein